MQMKIRGRYIFSKRAVSPVIASMLLIALSIAGGAAVTVVLNNIDGSQSLDTSDATLGALSSSSNTGELDISISLAKSSYNLPIFEAEAKKYYTSLRISVNYNAGPNDPSFIYVIDFDVFVYGEKLDEIVSWEISYANGAEVYSENGNFMGYKQPKNTNATYTVEVKDPLVKTARIFYETSFTYKLKVGSQPGIVDQIVEREEISKVVFNWVRYNVSIIHFGQNPADTTSALYYWITEMQKSNGSNKIQFIFNPVKDIYDIQQNDLVGLNYTAFSEYYQLVIFAEWAIQVDASAFARSVFLSNTPMLFAGTVENIRTQINATATEEIQGIIPNIGDVQSTLTITNNYYQFNTSYSSLLVGLSGVREEPYIDDTGNDAANIAPGKAIKMGISHIDIVQKFLWWTTPLFNHTGVSLALKEANATVGNHVSVSLILDHRTATYARTAMRNMLFYAFQEPERIIISQGKIVIDSVIQTDSAWWGRPSFIITATVQGGDLKVGSTNFTLIMSPSISWNSLSYIASVTIAGSVIPGGIPFTIDEVNGLIVLNIGQYYNQVITDGSQIIINIPDSGYLSNSFTLGSFNWADLSFIGKFEWFTTDDAFGETSKAATY